MFQNQMLFIGIESTLANTDELHRKIWNDLLDCFDITVTKDFYKSFIREKTKEDFIRRVCPQMAVDRVKRLVNHELKLFTEDCPKLKLQKDGLQFLENAKANGCTLVAVSNRNPTVTTALLDGLAVTALFDHCISSDSLMGLVSQTALKTFVEEKGVDQKKCCVIDGSLSGISAARALDLPCIGVAMEWSGAELQNVGASRIVSSIGELL
eukprot:GCRY01002833.1.p1 GENE.GCRY01002833.1~~GCRY01002833.1.p1  ORF type:complete len:210 (-),score=31.18 GCRY01002833.1:114-743(-)